MVDWNTLWTIWKTLQKDKSQLSFSNKRHSPDEQTSQEWPNLPSVFTFNTLALMHMARDTELKVEYHQYHPLLKNNRIWFSELLFFIFAHLLITYYSHEWNNSWPFNLKVKSHSWHYITRNKILLRTITHCLWWVGVIASSSHTFLRPFLSLQMASKNCFFMCPVLLD